jgi:shikimate kinase
MEKQKDPLPAEIVGLAGSGKTTIIRALSWRNGNLKIGADLSELQIRNRQHVPTFLRTFPRILPVLLQPSPGSRRPSWEEIKSIVYLEGWVQYIHQHRGEAEAVLLDQGPVFKLATLHGFGPEMLKSPRWKGWWTRMYRQWAEALGLVIWLDAPEAVLAKRIQNRAKRHEVKGKPEAEICEYLARYRSSFEHVLAQLSRAHVLTGLQFDTSKTPIDAIADEILAAVAVIQSGGPARESTYARIHSHQ